MFYTARSTFSYNEGLVGFLFILLLVGFFCWCLGFFVGFFVLLLGVFCFFNFGLFETSSAWVYMGGDLGEWGGCCAFSWIT